MFARIETLSEDTNPLWDSYVDGHADSTCYHHRAWQVAARDAYDMETPSLVARDENGEIAGVLPVFMIRNGVAPYAVTGVFGAYGHVLAATDELKFDLLNRAWQAAQARRARHFLHKSTGGEPAPPGWSTSNGAATATLSLSPGPDLLWKGFRSEIRNRVRKAEKAHLEVRLGAAEFPGFYDVLAANMHRLGTPIYGPAFLRRLLEAFGERAYLITLQRSGETIAGALVVEHRGVVNVPFISALQSAFALAPANLLYWEIIKRSCARGQTVLDFGRSFRNTSNLDFKLRWGATLVPQPFHFIHRGWPPHVEPAAPSIQRLVGIWKSVPRGLADRLGPWICAGFLA